MSNIVNDISMGINLIQGLINLVQKASHPLVNNETVNQILNQAHSYCNQMNSTHIQQTKSPVLSSAESEKTE